MSVLLWTLDQVRGDGVLDCKDVVIPAQAGIQGCMARFCRLHCALHEVRGGAALAIGKMRSHRSEPGNVGEGQLAFVNMHPAQFRAAMELREHLAGIQQSVRVKGAFDAHLLLQIVFGEHGRHQVALFNAHAVFAGQDTANLYTQF